MGLVMIVGNSMSNPECRDFIGILLLGSTFISEVRLDEFHS